LEHALRARLGDSMRAEARLDSRRCLQDARGKAVLLLDLRDVAERVGHCAKARKLTPAFCSARILPSTALRSAGAKDGR
jgi:hypothetical protein